MKKWTTKEQAKQYLLWVIGYSLIFSLTSWIFGAGILAMGVSTVFSSLIYIQDGYSRFAIICMFTIFSALFVLTEVAWLRFYLVGLLISHGSILLMHDHTEFPDCGPDDLLIHAVIKSGTDKEAVLRQLEDITERVKKYYPPDCAARDSE